MRLITTLCVLYVLCGTSYGLDRTAFTFTKYDLEVRVDPAGGALAARGKITVRNDSRQPQDAIALQISSSLRWRLITVGGKDVAYVENPYTSDIDHTGALNEAVARLPSPLAPNATLEIEVGYSGQIARSAARLTRLGVPAGPAAQSDWDRIEEAVTAVRGVGYVAWYPVSMPAVALAGPEYFPALAAWKDSQRDSEMRLNLCWVSEEESLNVVSNGTLLGVNRQVLGATEESTTRGGCSQFSFLKIGATVPSFAIGKYTLLSRPAISVYHLADDKQAAQEYAFVAEKVLPFTEQWFGPPRAKVTVIQIPDTHAVPWESGPMLFTPLETLDRPALEARMAHQLAHASLLHARLWIDEGLANFAMAIVREQQGRATALALLNRFALPLREAEKQRGAGIVNSTDEIMYGAKSMFVWWMLRDIVGDIPLQRALKTYRAGDDHSPSYMQDLISREAHRDLSWFFDDWVYRDRGLPDFRIAAAFPRQTLAQTAIVTITVENLGDAAAEVPVLLETPQGEKVQRVLVRGKDKSVVRIETPVAATEVQVNDGSVPESDTANNVFNFPK